MSVESSQNTSKKFTNTDLFLIFSSKNYSALPKIKFLQNNISVHTFSLFQVKLWSSKMVDILEQCNRQFLVASMHCHTPSHPYVE